MPQSPHHQRAAALLTVAATHLLGAEHEVFSDMNWYPPDGGNAMAPDVMVLPAGVVVAPPDSAPGVKPKSYRQDQLDGPPPSVVVEIPSSTDTFSGLMAKLYRCQRLGSVAYVVTIDGADLAVFRLGPHDRSLVAWTGRPIPELGGMRIDIVDSEIDITIGDGVHGTTPRALIAALIEAGTRDLEQRAEAERERAEAERERAEAERERAEALTRQLESLGVDPDA